MHSKPDADVAILGAGPAGAVAAYELGRAGLSVIVIDPDLPYRGHQIESFPASGAALADAIDLLQPICSTAYGPADSISMRWRDTAEVQQFDNFGPLLLHRQELRKILLAKALAASANTCHCKARVRALDTDHSAVCVATNSGGNITVRFVLDARGRRTAKRLINSTHPDTSASGNLVALPFCGKLPAIPKAQLHIESLRDAWLWSVHLCDGAVHGAIFQHASRLAGHNGAARILYGNDCLSQCHNDKKPLWDRNVIDLAKLTATQFGRPAPAALTALDDPFINSRILAIGDAALARDPIASHGLVHALRGGVQAAMIIRTLHDPQADHTAARAFARHKHRDALNNARVATSRAYRDQSRFDSSFWQTAKPMSAPETQNPISASKPLQLASALTRAPILDHNRIRWAPAIELPLRNDVAATLGPVSAIDIAAACRPPACLAEIATRLTRLHDKKAVSTALAHLISGGALRHN